MLFPYLALLPALAITLKRRLAAFRPLVILSAFYDSLYAVVWYAPWQADAHGANGVVLALDLLLEIAVAAYLLIHFRARTGRIAQSVAAPASPEPLAR